jgi:hypothetical protein
MNTRLRSLLLPACVLLLALAACDTQPNRVPRSTRTLELSPARPSPDVEIGLVSAVRIVLPGPEAGTGLSWEISSNNNKVLDPMGPMKAEAAAGTSSISFYALRPGKSVLRFVLVRTSEAEATPAAACQVTIRVVE